MKPFRIDTTVDAPLETVWRHLTDPPLIRDWFGWDHDGLDAEIRYIFVDNSDPIPPDVIAMGDDQEIRLVPAGGATTVRVTLAGDPTQARWVGVYDAVEEGWRTFFEQLRFKIARDVSARRTVFLDGSAAPASLAGALRAGEVWHESRHQQITVDGDGHLVALVSQAPLDSDTPADATLTVSTFGLDDAAFATVEDTWTTRWKALTA